MRRVHLFQKMLASHIQNARCISSRLEKPLRTRCFAVLAVTSSYLLLPPGSWSSYASEAGAKSRFHSLTLPENVFGCKKAILSAIACSQQ